MTLLLSQLSTATSFSPPSIFTLFSRCVSPVDPVMVVLMLSPLSGRKSSAQSAIISKSIALALLVLLLAAEDIRCGVGMQSIGLGGDTAGSDPEAEAVPLAPAGITSVSPIL